MKPDLRMFVQEVAHRLGLVRGEVVENDVNPLPQRAQGDHLV